MFDIRINVRVPQKSDAVTRLIGTFGTSPKSQSYSFVVAGQDEITLE